VRATTSQRWHQRVWCRQHGGFQTRCWLVVPAPTVAIVAYNPLQTHSSTLTTHGDHHRTWSRDMHSSCARNNVATKAPARLVYAARRFRNALLAHGTGPYGRQWRATPSKHIARLSKHLVTIKQLGVGICTPYVHATTSQRRHQSVWCTWHGGSETR